MQITQAQQYLVATQQMIVIKKYSNRRLYDTDRSGYITQDELAERIRGGDEVRVVDAKSGEDLTQVTLAQIILDSRGAARLLPVELLTQLVRMDDDALGEFFGKYVSWALQTYLAARRGAQSMTPYVPFATLPFDAAGAMARLLSSGFGWGGGPPPPPAPAPPAPSSPSPGASQEQLDALRRELDELKRRLADGD